MKHLFFGAALLFVSACAQPVARIAPEVSSTAHYGGWRCNALLLERHQVAISLAKAAKVQERAVATDVMSTLLIGIPVSGGGVADEIAQLKGRQLELQGGLQAGQCG